MSKVALITGASSGLGKEAAKALASLGYHVIAHGRDSVRIAQAEAEIRSVATGRVDMLCCDLAILSDTAQMAVEIARLTDRIDVLLANAGGMRTERVVTSEGNDASFAGNHLGKCIDSCGHCFTGPLCGFIKLIRMDKILVCYCLVSDRKREYWRRTAICTCLYFLQRIPVKCRNNLQYFLMQRMLRINIILDR